jgi:hypothetical protein
MRTLFPSRALLRRRDMYHILLFQRPNVKGNTTILHGIVVIQMETYGVDGALRLVWNEGVTTLAQAWRE